MPLHFSSSPTRIIPFPKPLFNPHFSLHKKTMSWACSSCTFLNPPTQKSSCQICLTPLPSSSSSSNSKWVCKACTFLNSYSHSSCEICDTRIPSSSSSFHDLDPDSDSGEPGSVGTVFYPLRRCNTGKGHDPNGFHHVGINGQAQISDDDHFVGKSVDLGVPRNSGSKRKFQDPVSENANSINDLMDKRVCTVEASASGVIKILTYNVWFREDLEVHRRMHAIGDLIHQHSPDVICFQEVTPNIYDILQKSNWWKKYRCSASYERAASEAYFCMQLAKLPVKSFSCKQFSYSAMGRELCVGEIKTNGDKSLVIATSHLESPCPGPPTWDQMFSKERVNQAKEAINHLQKYRNVIFCGDMNWDDGLDGPFPFGKGWFDAWEKLKPGEIGYTYDTKSNQMLSGNRKLQKRLDRFICQLPDFDVSRVEMIGMEAIPGLTYKKQKKMKNKIQELILPVLPSDHYGLLLTLTCK